VIREDLTVRTRDRTHEDLVHPNIVGFFGTMAPIIDESNADPVTMIVLEFMDGGCLQDVLTKNGRSWRPPQETSFSWYAPAPMQSIGRSTLEVQ
jgi:serine/threonine protein kinase